MFSKTFGKMRYVLANNEPFVHDDESVSELRSSKEEQEAFLLNSNDEPTSRKSHDHYKRLPRILLISLLILVLTNSAMFIVLIRGIKTGGPETSRQIFNEGMRVSHPLKEAPDFGLKLVVFDEDPAFMGSSPEVDENWQKLWPVGKGFIRAHGRDDEEEDYYLVSAFHQFHCLDVIRTFYNLVASNTPITDFKHIHVPHCVEYLRQTAICAADPTLEFTMAVSVEDDPAQAMSGHVHQFVDGKQVTHVCRNWDALIQWTESHRYKNSSGILHSVDM